MLERETVPELYPIKSIMHVRGVLATHTHDRSRPPVPSTTPSIPQNIGPREGCHRLNPLVEASTAEVFVSKLKQIQGSKDSSWHFDDNQHLTESQRLGYEYFSLSFDTSHEKCTFKLPPFPYAIHLLEQFTIYFGHDWHWFRLKSFRRQLENTYMMRDSIEAKNRIWLCKLLVVLALGESATAGQDSEHDIESDCSNPRSDQASPPGIDLFEQALRLLNIPYENALIDHVEVLNMIALYSNQLNRQKTAYMYAGSSARLCNQLQLHHASCSPGHSFVEREHRKRVWWSTYCLDQMTSLQRGLLPTLHADQTDLHYPSQASIPLEDTSEFADPDYLTARIQLTIIQANISKSISDFDHDASHATETVLDPILHQLTAWKAGLPSHMALEMEDGMPEPTRSLPCMRSLANLHLRFNQCLILLLRPIILKQVACIYANDERQSSEQDLQELNNACLRAARSSVRILVNIRSYGLLARLGLMENIHLFTSLMMVRLSLSINHQRPGSFDQHCNDATTYAAGKEVLSYMMRSGSLAAKGHLNMLNDIEELGNGMASNGGLGANYEEQWDFDEWMNRLLQGEDMPDIYNT
ncbi:fungal-specific transcription factor domain-containing protein [Aspergillus californicus]